MKPEGQVALNQDNILLNDKDIKNGLLNIILLKWREVYCSINSYGWMPFYLINTYFEQVSHASVLF